ncbi:DedA family protein [Longimicrobium sp.]|uniref:DedA family protein n=1 Tax=Longimicrobium sp. TaxID=2029185 RepID=UPI002D089FE9|nr:DedA family protein [Longimicrobium sp.]HSU16677.1 DedA family protein [Longimicrobium sp.]
MIDSILNWLGGLPPLLVYLVVGVISAVENVFPPVPADVVALFGGFLAGKGNGNPAVMFLVVWLGNLSTALLMYWVGRRKGTEFFRGRIGRMILQPKQMEKLSRFYQRRGTIVIFISRFLPMFRAVVPIFAGTSKVGFWRAAIPMALASAAWYGLIVYLGATAGENWEEIRATVESSGKWLAIAAAVLATGVGWWWWKSRREGAEEK